MASGGLARRDYLAGASIAIALLALYTANGTIVTTHDATSNTFLAANVVQEGRLWFSPSRDPQLFLWHLPGPGSRGEALHLTSLDPEARRRYALGELVAEPIYAVAPSVRTDPRTGEPLYVSTYGVGAGLAAVPLLAWARIFVPDLRKNPEWLWYGAKFAASLFTAASAAFVFWACRRWLALGPSLVLALAYGLGTCNWSMSSQTLWQHGSNSFFLALGTWILARAPEGLDRVRSGACGFAFAAATACRPTSLVYLVAVAAYLLVAERRALAAYVAGAVPILAAIASYQWYYLGSPLRSAQEETATWGGSFLEGLAGLLVSPSRGLFVFSPFFVFSLFGAVAAWRDRRYAVLRPLTLAVAALLAVHAKWSVWWGGDCYGYRVIADVAPALVLFLVPVASWVMERRALAGLFLAACGWAILLQGLGAWAYDVEWNEPLSYVVVSPAGSVSLTSPQEARALAKATGATKVYTEECSLASRCHGRLWSITESQPVFYFTHFWEARRALVEQTESMIAWWR